jgi:hypothetical protein
MMRQDILKPVLGLVGQIRKDYAQAQTAFTEGTSSLPSLLRPPHPAQILSELTPLPPQTDALQKTFSLPAVNLYEFPDYNTTVHEARRTFSRLAHPDFSDWVAGLHVFVTTQTGLLPTNSSEYWLAVSVFSPQENPYHLLLSGKTERLNPKKLIEYYAQLDKWQKFRPETLPNDVPQKINAALQRASLF